MTAGDHERALRDEPVALGASLFGRHLRGLATRPLTEDQAKRLRAKAKEAR
jgi:hypothetical protein